MDVLFVVEGAELLAVEVHDAPIRASVKHKALRHVRTSFMIPRAPTVAAPGPCGSPRGNRDGSAAPACLRFAWAILEAAPPLHETRAVSAAWGSERSRGGNLSLVAAKLPESDAVAMS